MCVHHCFLFPHTRLLLVDSLCCVCASLFSLSSYPAVISWLTVLCVCIIVFSFLILGCYWLTVLCVCILFSLSLYPADINWLTMLCVCILCSTDRTSEQQWQQRGQRRRAASRCGDGALLYHEHLALFIFYCGFIVGMHCMSWSFNAQTCWWRTITLELEWAHVGKQEAAFTCASGIILIKTKIGRWKCELQNVWVEVCLFCFLL